MVVRCRPELCEKAMWTAREAKTAKSTRRELAVRDLRVPRAFVAKNPTLSFYFARRRPGGNYGEGQEEKNGRNLA